MGMLNGRNYGTVTVLQFIMELQSLRDTRDSSLESRIETRWHSESDGPTRTPSICHIMVLTFDFVFFGVKGIKVKGIKNIGNGIFYFIR